MSFQNAVINTSDIAHCYQSGLGAIKNNERDKFSFRNTRLIEGSVDIDSCTMSKYPQDSRWDYVIGYGNSAHFVEIHPAQTGNVEEVRQKIIWLKDWLKAHGSQLFAHSPKFYWIASGKVAIRKGSPQEKKLNALGLFGPKERLCL